MHLELC